MVHCLIKTSRDGFIYAHNTSRRAIKLMKVTQTKVSTKNANASNVRNRSKLNEKVLQVSSSVKGQTKESDRTIQLKSIMLRSKETYRTVAEQAGLTIFETFTPEQSAAL